MKPLPVLAIAGWVDDVGRALSQAGAMLFITLWPLILGFALSGIVQAFVSRETLQRRLGDHRPAAVFRASAFGMASSSCSYAASAMARALFARGADFVATTTFMVASTNLVVEVGIVLVALMGWQFAVGELTGGIVMIVLLALLGGWWFGAPLVARARGRLELQASGSPGSGSPRSGSPRSRVATATPRRASDRWRDAASYTVADIRMVAREIFVGYAIGGTLSALVPTSVTRAVFLHGHGPLTTVWDAAVGPAIAMVSSVCSIGNIPIAAALWRGGIAFGGVVSFLFADLIAFPLLLVYRRYYGTRLMLRMLALFWVAMAVAGLATQLVFEAAGLTPSTRARVAPAVHIGANATTILDVLLVAVLLAAFWMHRRWRGSERSSRVVDPVCGMVVEAAVAPASVTVDGAVVYFCSERCLERFGSDQDAPSTLRAR